MGALTQNHGDDWKAKANKQINNDSTTFLCAREHHGVQSSNLVEATVNTK
jgi:hypothetical protein